jgi:hypothetical protein
MTKESGKRNDCEDREYEKERVSRRQDSCSDRHDRYKNQQPEQRGIIGFPLEEDSPYRPPCLTDVRDARVHTRRRQHGQSSMKCRLRLRRGLGFIGRVCHARQFARPSYILPAPLLGRPLEISSGMSVEQ